ncbi:piggybac transposable element-derived protein 4 [Holotrichia oblita]|uniref:Piggybac transposable element-derived protein 4 n=1 Tax=Holotrichia oblita TaxID=644536 RepID=A0ACB9TV24_HOLOL|nr:piggybac transposable element-derived protein 4 [Holotrichia oblita]
MFTILLPNTQICVVERLAAYRGNCSFRVYMKSKSGRYGIKIWVGADCETLYFLNLQIYTGMQDRKQDVIEEKRVVTDLIAPYYGSWRGITMDNFFSLIPLADKLYANKVTHTGTMRSNKTEISNPFLDNRPYLALQKN